MKPAHKNCCLYRLFFRILYCKCVIIVLLAFNVHCQNPFSTREPEQPSGMQSLFVPPVTPETVLDNLKSSISERNVENYIRCFGLSESVRSNFRFVPELSVANNHQEIFAQWSIVEERNYINRLFSPSLLPSDSISSLILTDVTESQFGDSVITTKKYDLLVSHKNSSTPKQVIGHMELSLRKDSSALWYIAYWADFKTGDFPVWSQLKAEF